MNRRIMIWGLLGLLVACGWAIFGVFAGPEFNLGRSAVVAATTPAVLIGRKMPLGLVLAALLNGCIYALLGLTIETGRRVFSRI